MTIPAASPSAADPGRVTSEIRAGVATVRFHHPKGNSLPAGLLRNLAAEVTSLGRTPSARVIVLRSEGTGPFCAGASFEELASIRDAEAGKEFFMGFARLILAMRDAPKFVLARVHGRTVGGGVGVAAAADYAIGLDSASVRLSELAVGIGPFVVGPVIEKKIGPAAFQALAVDASNWRDAAWAERVGLFARVVPSVAELDSVLDALATRLASSNPEAMARMKAIFWQGTEHWDRLLAERAEMSGTLVLSEFTRTAIAAFAAR
jgi:methylglutaconyl-CoA hydratase